MGRKQAGAGKYLYVCAAFLIILSCLGCASLGEKGQDTKGTAMDDFRIAKELLENGDFAGAEAANRRVLEMYPNRHPGDEAAFNIGIILAHHANPERDFTKSIEYFKRVIRDFPPGVFTEQARVWTGVLYSCEEVKGQLAETTRQLAEVREELKTTEEELEDINAKLDEAKSKREDRVVAENHLIRGRRLIAQGNFEGALDEQQKVISRYGNKPPGDEALFTIGVILAYPDNPKKDYRKALDVFRRMAKEFPQSPLAELAKVYAGVLDVIEKTKQVDIEIEQKKKDMAR
ncbi:MAG: tetratricopeptide repeat protein [Chloroflexota bacterium]